MKQKTSPAKTVKIVLKKQKDSPKEKKEKSPEPLPLPLPKKESPKKAEKFLSDEEKVETPKCNDFHLSKEFNDFVPNFFVSEDHSSQKQEAKSERIRRIRR